MKNLIILFWGCPAISRDDLKLTTEIYYKQSGDLIVRNDRTNQLRRNDGDGWAAGIDLSLIKRLVNKFYGQINYSYAQSKRDDHNGEGEYNSDFNQPHISRFWTTMSSTRSGRFQLNGSLLRAAPRTLLLFMRTFLTIRIFSVTQKRSREITATDYLIFTPSTSG